MINLNEKGWDSKTEHSQHIDPLCFPTEILYAFLICPCVLHATLVTCFLHFTSTGEDCKLLNRTLRDFFPVSCKMGNGSLSRG